MLRRESEWVKIHQTLKLFSKVQEHVSEIFYLLSNRNFGLDLFKWNTKSIVPEWQISTALRLTNSSVLWIYAGVKITIKIITDTLEATKSQYKDEICYFIQSRDVYVYVVSLVNLKCYFTIKRCACLIKGWAKFAAKSVRNKNLKDHSNLRFLISLSKIIRDHKLHTSFI